MSQVPSVSDTSAMARIGERMIAAMRLVLAVSALLIIYIDPSEPDRYIAVTYGALGLYVVYSATLYASLLYRRSFLPAELAHWLDVGWYVVLISLSSGTNSIFFIFFFFAILVASFRWGFREGLRVVVVSASLFTAVGFATAPGSQDFELNRFLLRPVSLLVLGYMTAYWGGFEIMLKRRLSLLKDISSISNPRFGVDRTIGSIMERLRAFYDADACLLVMGEETTGEYSLRRADGQDPEAAVRAEPITTGLAELLLAVPAEQAMVYSGEPRVLGRWRLDARASTCDVAKGNHVTEPGRLSGALAAESFVTVPFRYRGETVGRLYLTASRRRAFAASDVDFLLQVLDHTMPIIENIRLVDRLASDASETERQRIARDIHDSVIQPYIGLQIGLVAVKQKLAAGGADLEHDIDHLLMLVATGIDDLRRHVKGLRDGAEGEGSFLPAVQRFAAKFAEATGIAVRIETASDIRINDRLAAEVFQIVAEGLSNVRRHTSSTQATIVLARDNGLLTLRIANAGGGGTHPSPPAQSRSVPRHWVGTCGWSRPRTIAPSSPSRSPCRRRCAMSLATPKRIRILIVDDHALVSAGLRMLIESQPGMAVVGQATNGPDAVAAACRERPDIILLDLDLSGHNALDFLPQLVAAAPAARVLILTGVLDPALHRRAVRLGAVGLVLKERAADVLLQAIEKVHAGEVWLERSMIASVLGQMTRAGRGQPDDPEQAKIATLTGREREVIALVGQGLKNREIAERLYISETTVTHHLTSSFDKLGLSDRIQLLVYAHRHGLARPFG